MGQRSAVRLGGTMVAVLMVAGAVTSNQVLNNGVWSAPWLVAALAMAGLTVVLDRRLNPSPALAAPMLNPRLSGPDGLPMMFRDVAVIEVGVHDGKFITAPYLSRPQADAALRGTLGNEQDGERPAARRVVLVEGPRLAGTTRTLAEAAKAALSDYRVAWFVDDPRVSLAEMIAQAGRWARRDLYDYDSPAMGVVVWFESMPESRLRELAHLLDTSASAPVSGGALPEGVWLLATHELGELDEARDQDQIDQTLETSAVRVPVLALTEDERAELASIDAYAALRTTLEQEADVLVGRLMIAWTAFHQALMPGQAQGSTDRIALLHAVTDWERIRMPRPLTDDILTSLFVAYRNALTTARPSDPAAGLRDALAWATTQGTGKEKKRPPLITAISTGQRRNHRYLPHPLLPVLADEDAEPLAWPIDAALWHYADRFCTPAQRRGIALTALRRDAFDAAARLLDHRGTPQDPAAYRALADHYHRELDRNKARHWYQRTINTNDPDTAPGAMVSLGLLERSERRVDEARGWYAKAAESGDAHAAPQAMSNLGILETDQGQVEKARRWFRKAIGSGHPDYAPQAMSNLGSLEKNQGQIEKARYWLAKAIKSDHLDATPNAMLSLAILERRQGHLDEARDWFKRAIESGHPNEAPKAMSNLGVLEKSQGRIKAARRWYMRAIESGHPDAAPTAMGNLAILEAELGKTTQARRWYVKTVESGHSDAAPKAMLNIGLLEAGQGRMMQARTWYAAAIKSGHFDEAPKAMLSLGNIEKEQRKIEEARSWYEMAVKSGHPNAAPKAMLNIGLLEAGQGRMMQARTWYERTKQSDHAEAGLAAQRKLDELDRRERELHRAHHFGQYSSQAYANPNLMSSTASDDRST